MDVNALRPRVVGGRSLTGSATWSPSDDVDPSAWTVMQAVEYVMANPDMRVAVIAAEREGKNRSTLIGRLETLQF